MEACLENIYKIEGYDTMSVPLVFDSPHSGTIYPADFGFSCDPLLLATAEDTLVDDLFESVPANGGVLLKALFPRSYIDVNRAESDIDEDLLSEPWPLPVARDGRAAAGYGLVRRLIRPGFPIYDRTLGAAEIQRRIETCYRPYHSALKHLLDETHKRYGHVWHIDCHSMPSSSAYASNGAIFRPLSGNQIDFVLGTRDGTSCSGAFMREVKTFLQRKGYRVSVNNPYKGMEILRRYGDPVHNRHSLQIEISKALYLDESANRPSAQYPAFKETITELIKFVHDCTERFHFPAAAD
jgi:N-formylglutamate amidohydrolase